MKKSIRNIIAAAACGVLVVGALALVGCGSSSSSSSSSDTNADTSSADMAADIETIEDGKLIVGTSADFPPFEYLDGDECAGFDMAIMNKIGEELGLEVEFKNTDFDTLISQVAAGETIDVAISGITVTDERMEEVDFTDTYYDSNLAIVTLSSSDYASKADLTDAKIGVQKGTSGSDWAEENLKDADITSFKKIPDALQSLKTGKVDALVYDLPVAESNIAGEYSDCQIIEEIATGEQYAIAVNKGNTALTEAMNTVIQEMKDDGSLDTLFTEERDKADTAGQ